jgi:excisionase family DNA binding protein
MNDRKTMSIPEAASYLGIGRNSAYGAARAGQIPTIRIGRLLRVPIAALERMLEQADKSSEPNRDAACPEAAELRVAAS